MGFSFGMGLALSSAMIDKVIAAGVGRIIKAYLPLVDAVKAQLEAMGILPVLWVSIREGNE